jgi:hypothetical protein
MMPLGVPAQPYAAQTARDTACKILDLDHHAPAAAADVPCPACSLPMTSGGRFCSLTQLSTHQATGLTRREFQS